MTVELLDDDLRCVKGQGFSYGLCDAKRRGETIKALRI